MIPRAATIGHIIAPRGWGIIAKCPHCPATDIVRMAKHQKTCGSYRCQLAQNEAMRKRRTA